ncbi:MAG: hypothetical protein PVH93_08770 [Nitrosopumilaceae archaeon]
MSTLPNQPKKIDTKPHSNQTNQDVYSAFQDSLERYFSEIKKNTSNYLQSVSDLQEEIIDSRKKNAERAIELQKVAYEKMGGNSNVPSAVMDLATTIAGTTVTSWTMQNKLVLESLDTLSRNIEAFNKNSTSFDEINKRLINYWASIIKQEFKKNQ